MILPTMKGFYSLLLVLVLGACVQGMPNPSAICLNGRSCGLVTKVVVVEGDERNMQPGEVHSHFCECPAGQQCSSKLGYSHELPALENVPYPNRVTLTQPGFCMARDPVTNCDEDTLTLSIPVMNPAINLNQYCRCPNGRNMVSQAQPQDPNGPPSLYKIFVCPE